MHRRSLKPYARSAHGHKDAQPSPREPQLRIARHSGCARLSSRFGPQALHAALWPQAVLQAETIAVHSTKAGMLAPSTCAGKFGAT
eukprot:10084489-Alexandrium_andersonii.AAC.1